jgi:uncharacterized protein YbjQ (UPF0145 family)
MGFLSLMAAVAVLAIALEAELKIKAKNDRSKIYYSASAQSAEIKVVEKGVVLESEKKEGEWYQVSFQDKSGFTISGYIHQNDIEFIDDKSISSPIKAQAQVSDSQADAKPSVSIPTESPDKSQVLAQVAPDSLRYRATGKVLMTTSDIHYEYDIVGLLTHYQEFGTFTLRDPLEGAIKKGTEEFEKKAAKMGGDAVIGLRYEFANRTEKDEGRLLIYGTVIKFR